MRSSVSTRSSPSCSVTEAVAGRIRFCDLNGTAAGNRGCARRVRNPVLASAAARLTVAGRLEPTVEAALGRLIPASPRHLALVEATRIAYQRAAKAKDRQD